MRFLLVEDHEDLGRSVQERLRLEGHAVDLARTLADARAFQTAATYDLILLDIMLPDGDGRHFLAEQRRAGDGTPVIVMTARAAVTDRVGTLDMGADDYITKPFDYAELEARCRAILRRRGGVADTRRRCGDVIFDPLAGTVEVNGEIRELRSRELRLLEVFLGAPGRILSKEHLLDRLFSFSEPVSDNAIEVYVGRLRRKLAGSRLRIDTMRGLGYRLTEG
ncbi:response regulator [Microvirga tunisiensis]|uniref:Response regulator n=2 Tax=Pannonibacter tanglangensis TaxID=2750084 RepID=A0A7X5F0P8_9HYPH|nr:MULTISPECIES: response regulator transcription factor [unclassified Pannonibacter]NBN63995.1 response regulator [Pannonibacter sp. XCT-34]NBN77632.1 response regulator [Pannonibacter sp. XCT-53]